MPVGPRLGVAYQITPKTVLRAGIGVIYSRTASNDFQSYATRRNPGQYPVSGVPAGVLNFFDQNGGFAAPASAVERRPAA
jgi:preprotein translocase subunit Sec61beta